MLRISKKADYAVFLLGAIARQGAFPGGSAADSVVSAHEIARQANLNKSVVANLLKCFAKDGLLESVRGLKGGYRLARTPHEVTLGQVLHVIDGPFNLVDCIRLPEASGSGDEHHCNLIAFCPTKNPMRVVHDRIERLFAEITLAEMCGLGGCPAPAFTFAATSTAASQQKDGSTVPTTAAGSSIADTVRADDLADSRR
ncbi:MAG: Rrf2 family transcriptional regulator [Planctomycetota bacterium]